MDHIRYHEIIEELSDYNPSAKAGAIMSTVTIGEIVELAKAADTIERMQRELDLSLKAEKSAVHTAAEVITERDAALAEVKRWKRKTQVAQENAKIITRLDRNCWR